MGLRRLLFGSKRRALLVVVLVLAASVGGAYTLGVVGAPEVTGVENTFGPADRNETTVYTDLVVENPNPIGVELGGTAIDYTVSMNDVEMANGSKRGVDVRPGTNRVPFTTTMDNERIPEWWVTHIRNDETTQVRVDATVHSSLLDRSFALPQERTITTDIIGQFRSTEERPIDADQPLVSDPVLVVRETDAAWGEVTSETTPIEMEFVVFNPKATSYAITEIGYNITMNDLVVGSGATEDPYVLQANSETTVRATTGIENDRLDDWWVTHLERNQTTDLRIDFYAEVRIGGTTVRVPLDELTYTRTIETDLFGTKNDADAPDGTRGGSETTATPSSDGTGAGGETTDGSDGATTDGGSTSGTTTSAPTATPTPTPSPTPETTTTTDDGGLLDGGNDSEDGTDEGGVLG